MPTWKGWDGCIAIPGTKAAAIAVTFIFVIVVVVVGHALRLSGAEIAGVLTGAGSFAGPILAVAMSQRRASRPAAD